MITSGKVYRREVGVGQTAIFSWPEDDGVHPVGDISNPKLHVTIVDKNIHTTQSLYVSSDEAFNHVPKLVLGGDEWDWIVEQLLKTNPYGLLLNEYVRALTDISTKVNITMRSVVNVTKDLTELQDEISHTIQSAAPVVPN